VRYRFVPAHLVGTLVAVNLLPVLLS